MGEGLRQIADKLPAHRMGDDDAARRRRLLQADDEADRGAEAVGALDENIRQGDGQAHLDRVVGWAAGVAVGHRRLEGDRPADAVLDVDELDEAAIAHGLEHVAAVGGERRPEDAAADRGKLGQRAHARRARPGACIPPRRAKPEPSVFAAADASGPVPERHIFQSSRPERQTNHATSRRFWRAGLRLAARSLYCGATDGAETSRSSARARHLPAPFFW